MRRLIWAFAGRAYHIVGNLMSRLINVFSYQVKKSGDNKNNVKNGPRTAKRIKSLRVLMGMAAFKRTSLQKVFLVRYLLYNLQLKLHSL